MDFTRSEAADELGALAERILDQRCTHERLRELEAVPGPIFDRDLWASLAESGIVGALVPEAFGGAGLALTDLVTVFEQVGRRTAPVPFVATSVMAATVIAEFASEDVRAALLPGIADGSLLVTVALEEARSLRLDAPSVRATPNGDAWALVGGKALVPYGEQAAWLVVSAKGPEGAGLYLVDASAEGITVTPQLPSSRQPFADVAFAAVPATPLGGGVDAIAWVAQRGAAAICALQAGVCEGALQMTAEHTRTRRQFDKAIGEFQAVGQRAADAFIDTEMIRLTAWQALFQLEDGRDAAEAAHSAKFWAGDAGMRVVHAAQHLHGGLGVDLDYPLHRHFLWAKQHEHTLGSPTRELIRLGALLADTPV